MRVPLADLRSQYYELKLDIDAALVGVIESGSFIDGPLVQELEQAVARECGARFGLGVASGTDALVLSLVACGIERGDEVITTPFTFGATTEAIALLGARPVYVDIDPCTYNLDVNEIQRKVTSRTRGILPVDLFGQMAHRGTMVDVARRFGLKAIVDSAQAIGAEQVGRRIGEDGDTTTLSFYPTKNLGAYGDAGMILTNDPDIAERLRSLHAHGAGRSGAYGVYERVGYCSRLDTMQAAILLKKLPHLRRWNEGRRRNAAMYGALLADLTEYGIQLPRTEAGNYHIYHQYTIRHPQRDLLQMHLRERGVESKVFYHIPMHLQPADSYLGYQKGDFPAAERAANEVLSIPIHPELTEDQIEHVAHVIREFVTGAVQCTGAQQSVCA